MELEYS